MSFEKLISKPNLTMAWRRITTTKDACYKQFFREFLMALELGDAFVLLCDSRSPTFSFKTRDAQRGLFPFLLSLVPEHLHPKVKILYIQEVVEAIRGSGRHEWIGEFETKYGLAD